MYNFLCTSCLRILLAAHKKLIFIQRWSNVDFDQHLIALDKSSVLDTMQNNILFIFVLIMFKKNRISILVTGQVYTYRKQSKIKKKTILSLWQRNQQ